jgi:ribosomal protein S18 acetylase RimI-like enzyme
MLLRPEARWRAPTVASSYELVAVPSEQLSSARPVVELDGALTDAQWEHFAERVLPDGLFLARERRTGGWIGTVSAIHNPRGGRFYFPGGGEIGYLVVDSAHRGRGLGLSLVLVAVTRLRAAGYRTIWLGVKAWRVPAIRTYLAAGFVPFLHGPAPDALEARWREVFSALGRTANPSEWLRELPA